MLLRTSVRSDRGKVVRTRGRFTLTVVYAWHRPRHVRLHACRIVVCATPISQNHEGDDDDADETADTGAYYDSKHGRRKGGL